MMLVKTENKKNQRVHSKVLNSGWRGLKILSYLLVFLFAGLSLSAQNIALKGGVSYTNISDWVSSDQLYRTYSLYTNPRTSFHLAASAEFPLRDSSFALQTGLRYSGIAYDYEFQHATDLSSYSAGVSTQLFYLDLPLTLKFTLQEACFQPYFYGGGFLGLGLHGKEHLQTLESSPIQENKVNRPFKNEKFKRLNYGALVGAGLHFGPVFLELSYSMGLTDFNSSTQEYYNNQTRVWALSIGYRLGLL